MTRLRMAVVGVGHLGKEHARILSQLPDIGVVDPRAVQATAVAQRCQTLAFTCYRDVLNLVDAVVIAAPTAEHHGIASPFLRRGIPVLVEKPIAADLRQATELTDLAEARDT